MKEPTFYTDLQAPNIFYNGDWDEVKEKVEEEKRNNPSIEQCSRDHPYYNGKKDVCIICPEEYPLFDYKGNRCLACTGESYYNP